MDKMISMMAVVLVSLTVSAEAYFSIVNTVAYAAKDSSPSDANAAYYSGYLCTVESAADLFGGKTSAAGMTSYVSSHYQAVMDNIADDCILALAADAEGYFGGQYAVSAYSEAALANTGYLALLVYSDGKNQAFRAFGEGSASFANGIVTFDDNGSSAVTPAIGAWTAVSIVPEPTSGILLLLGIVGIALKRKRNVV